MKTIYKGHEIEVYREKCLAGYPLIYYSVFRGTFEVTSGFFDTGDTVRQIVKHLKERVDDEMSKYEAAKEFYNGVRKAMFREPSPSGFKWNEQTAMFNDGYRYGRSIIDDLHSALNASLKANGFGEMDCIVPCEVEQ